MAGAFFGGLFLLATFGNSYQGMYPNDDDDDDDDDVRRSEVSMRSSYIILIII